jgi:hypothetical protein
MCSSAIVKVMFDIFLPAKKYQTLLVYRGLFALAQINLYKTFSRVSAHVPEIKEMILTRKHKLGRSKLILSINPTKIDELGA